MAMELAISDATFRGNDVDRPHVAVVIIIKISRRVNKHALEGPQAEGQAPLRHGRPGWQSLIGLARASASGLPSRRRALTSNLRSCAAQEALMGGLPYRPSRHRGDRSPKNRRPNSLSKTCLILKLQLCLSGIVVPGIASGAAYS